MAITVTKDYPSAKRIGPSLKMLSGSIAFDSSYPTGGEPANAANGVTRNFKSCKQIICEQTGGYMFQFDQANSKIKVLYPVATQANHQHNFQVKAGTIGTNMTVGLTVDANTADLVGAAGITANRILVAGTTPVQTAGAISAAVGEEVANGANLAGLTAVRFVAYGY